MVTSGRTALAIRVGWGVFLVAAPRPVTGWVAGREGDEVRPLARVLGVRHLVQAVVLGRGGRRRGWRLAGTAADGLHVASLVAAGGLASGPWRRAAIADLGPEVAVSALSWRAGRAGPA